MAAWEICPQDGGVSESFTLKMAAWEFCPQDGGVSEGFTHKMVAWEICLQDVGNAAFLRVYPQDGDDKQNVNKNNIEYILCSLDFKYFLTCQTSI